MAKKQKYDAPQGSEQQTIGANDVGTIPAAVLGTAEAPKVSPIGVPRYPTLYLADNETGLHYKFDRRGLPKKAVSPGAIIIDGVAVPFQVTSSKGWAASPELVIDYLYFSIPQPNNEAGEEQPGIQGFITLDYAVEGKTFVDRAFTLHEGTPDRFPMKADKTGYAERIGKTDTEEARKKAFKDTMAKKAAEAKAAAEANPQAETQPAT
jgi:hypothetical protein